MSKLSIIIFCLTVFFAFFYPFLYFVLLCDKHDRAWFGLLVFDALLYFSIFFVFDLQFDFSFS